MDNPWYEKGLRFKCTGCGKCCTGSPGYVWVTEEEIEKIAAFLKLSKEDVLRRYTKKVGNRLSLVEKSAPYDCVFLEGKQCQIYMARPKQCKAFPWWPEHLQSEEQWEEVAKRCEGVNHEEAPVISLEEIHSQLKILE